MIYLAGIFVFLVLILFPITIIYSFRLGASVYHSGLRQGPVLPLVEDKEEDEKDKKSETEERWDTA